MWVVLKCHFCLFAYKMVNKIYNNRFLSDSIFKQIGNNYIPLMIVIDLSKRLFCITNQTEDLKVKMLSFQKSNEMIE